MPECFVRTGIRMSTLCSASLLRDSETSSHIIYERFFMPYAASLSQLGPTADAVESVCSEVLEQLNGETPDL